MQRFECHVINFALSLYLALDESATEKPPVLRPSPQTWEVTFVDEHLLVVRSTYGRFLSYKGSFIFRSIDTSPTLGDDERFMCVHCILLVYCTLFTAFTLTCSFSTLAY